MTTMPIHNLDQGGLTNFTGTDQNFYNISHEGDSRYNETGDEIKSFDSVTKNLAVPSSMFFLGVLGNVTALIILFVKPSKDSKATAFYHLVKALICMDLFGIVASSPVTVIVYINGGLLKTGGMALCHYFSFILVMAGNATVLTVLIMAFERFLVSKYPFKYSRLVTPLTVNCSIAFIWGLSFLMAVLPILGMGRNVSMWPGTWCFFDYRNSDIGGHIFSYLYSICGLLAIFITIILNLTVIQNLWRMRRNRLITSSFRSTSSDSPNHSGRVKSGPDSERRMVIFLMAVTIVFTVCYGPLMVRIIMNQLLNSETRPLPGGPDDKLDLWALRLASFNQILDPWVYIISRVTCCKGSRDKDEVNHSRSFKSSHIVNRETSHHSSPQNSKRKHNLFERALQGVRNTFPKKKHVPHEKDTLTTPLHGTPTQNTPTSSVKNGVHGNIVKEEVCLSLCQNGHAHKEQV